MTIDQRHEILRLLTALDSLSEENDRIRRAATEAIAVVGMAIRTPFESDNLSMWEGLSRGVDASRDIPAERWNAEEFYDPTPLTIGKSITKRGSFLTDVTNFDAGFFSISPAEADVMDPQQRLLLEMAWEALASAGIPISTAAQLRTGVFAGVIPTSFDSVLSEGDVPSEYGPYLATGGQSSVAAGRISYALGLTGPCVAVDTACSSSLVAIHLACDSLRSRTSDVALAAGVQVTVVPKPNAYLSNVGALSTDGRCRTFDARGNGYGRGEGCGVVVLKRVSDALRDGDRVLALIRGSAVNQDGRSDGLTAPNGDSQKAVIRASLEFASLSPTDVQYVEAHGTGTVLGDPIEVDALSEVFGAGRTKAMPLKIGSLKSNIGHLEAAAGVAGLIKLVSSIQHGQLPPSLHFETPNPHIPWDHIPLEVQTKLGPWPQPDQPLVAGVSSFGFSGTNAHVTLSEAREDAAIWTEADRLAAESKVLPLCISAKTPQALRAYAKRFAAYLSAPLAAPTTWRDVAFTAALRQTHLEHRLVVVGSSPSEWSSKLQAFENGEFPRGVTTGTAPSTRTKVVFVFPGQGSQWLGMGRGLFASSPVFRDHILRCEEAFRPFVGWSLSKQLSGEGEPPLTKEIDVIQPMIFAVQTGLAALWRLNGVVPTAVVGHSMGEVAAAFVAGALTLEDAARVICVRSKLLRQVRGRGAMAALEMTMEAAERELGAYGGKLSVAASNGPSSTVVSGDAEAIASLLKALEARNVFCRAVKVDVASHSAQVDELKAELVKQLAELRPQKPTLRFVSTALVDPSDKPSFDASYWWSNLREPVRLSQRVKALVESGHELFVELSPHPVLIVGLEESLRDVGKTGAVLPSMRREESELEVMQESLGALHSAGYPVDWKQAFAVPGRVVSLPAYPWQRQHYWPKVAKRSVRKDASAWSLVHRSYSSSEQLGKRVFEADLDLSDPAYAYLTDHQVKGDVWLPGASYLEVAVEVANVAFPSKSVSVEDTTFSDALILTKEEPVVLQVVLQPEQDGAHPFRIASRVSKDTDAPWREHARGRIVVGRDERPTASSVALSSVQSRCTRQVDVRRLYDEYNERGIAYGPAFQGLEAVWAAEGEALAKLVASERLTSHTGGYAIHPAVLDSAFQSSTVAVGGTAAGRTYVPASVGSVRAHGNGSPNWVHAVVRSATPSEIVTSLVLFDVNGRVAMEIDDLRVVPIGKGSDKLDDSLFELVWRPSESKGSKAANGTWLLFADTEGVAAKVRACLEKDGLGVVTVSRGDHFQKRDATHYDVDPSQESLRRLMKEVFSESPPSAIVSLFALDSRSSSDVPLDEAIARKASDLACTSIVHLTQAVAQIGWSQPPRLFIITRGCQAATGASDVLFPEQALAWGVGATITHEMPELRTTLVDVAVETPAETLASELVQADDENRVALRGGGRWVPRLGNHVRAKARVATRQLLVTKDEGYQLDVLEIGQRASLALQPMAVPTPRAGEIVVRTHASGLSARDVTLAAATHDDGRLALGTESAGTVHSVGPGVDSVRVGDAVVTSSVHGFDAYVVVPQEFVIKKPATLTYEQAAALPSATMTAVYALDHVARLRRDEAILIHSATGGVGLAAIQYATHLGAQIFATAGSAEKRAYLQRLGVKHVYDSRSPSWVEEIKRDTAGRGVDVVLNSLLGDAFQKGLSVLAPFGRFVELGHPSVQGSYALRSNVTVSAVAIDQLRLERPREFRALLEKVFSLVDSGVVSPPPVQSFPISRAADAFEHLAQARHIGKLVLAAEERVPVRDPLRSDQVQPGKTYLVTGGLGGLGLVVAKRLAELGATHIALMGRGEPSDAAQATIRDLEGTGVQVSVVRADVSDRSSLERGLQELERTAPPVAGVIHLAAVLDDATIPNLTDSRVARVLAPKVLGAIALDGLIPDAAVSVYFSSVAGVLGSAGQAAYAAANTFLDAFAHQRSRSRHSLSIAWGAWADVGLATTAERVGNLARQGLASFTPAEGAEVFARLLPSTSASVAAFPVDWRQWQQANPRASGMPLLREVVASSAMRPMQKNDGLLGRFKSARSRDERLTVLGDYLADAVASVLRVAPESLVRTAPFKQLGFDSLMTISLKNTIERDLGLPLSTATLFGHSSVERLAAYLTEKLGASADNTASPASPPSKDERAGAEPPVDLKSLAFADRMARIEEEIDDE